ncbi:MAG: hypothetical protein R3B70_00695 [Polyangiaceae bacterium]
MKSFALSLLVALGVSLGAASASAEAARPAAPTAYSQMQQATRLAAEHTQRAQQHRLAARVATEAAKDCLRIATNNDKQGFPYEAGVMRAKAAQHQQTARASTEAAQREEALAAKYKAEAAHYLQKVQGSMTR